MIGGLLERPFQVLAIHSRQRPGAPVRIRNLRSIRHPAPLLHPGLFLGEIRLGLPGFRLVVGGQPQMIVSRPGFSLRFPRFLRGGRLPA